MSHESEPDWNQLPHNPRGFFQLQVGFDRNDLKRQYNKLIKRFRPEREPTLFQKIRSAFEQLDSLLRYGQSAVDTLSSQPYQWNSDTEAPISVIVIESSSEESPDESQPTSSQQSDRASFAEDWNTADPHELYKRYQSKNAKSPYDYYALSILSDVAAKDDSQPFIRWLLTGLKEHPQDPALYALIYQWSQISDLRSHEAITILIAMAEAIGDDRFYFVAERLLNQLANQLEWSQFQGLLTRCEQSLRGHHIQGKLVFYIQLLRKVMMRAPKEWLDERIKWIDINTSSIARQLEYEIEINHRLLEYRNHRETFLTKGEIARRIDLCILSYCLDAEEVSDQKIVELNVEIASDFSQLGFGLHTTFTESIEPLGIWNLICRDVAYRFDLFEDTHQSEHLVEYTDSLMRQIDDSFPKWRLRSWEIMNWVIRIAYLAPCVVCVFQLAFILSRNNVRVDGSAEPPGTLLGVILFGVVCFFDESYLWKKIIYPRRQKRLRSVVTAEYHKAWRAIIARFISANRVGTSRIIQCSEVVLASRHGEEKMSKLLPQLLSEDAGLFVFGVATLFLK